MIVLDGWIALAQFCKRLRLERGLSRPELAAEMTAASGENVTAQIIRQAESTTQASRFAARKRVLSHFGYNVSEGYVVTPDGDRTPEA